VTTNTDLQTSNNVRTNIATGYDVLDEERIVIPNPLRPLLPFAATVGFYEGMGNNWEKTELFMPLFLLLLAEVLLAEYRGATRSWQVAWTAFWMFCTTVIFAALFSWLVPIVLWILTIAVVYAFRVGPTAQGATAEAWRASGLVFQQRRSVLGRHYRWRVALALLPHLAYLFVVTMLFAAVMSGAIGIAGFARRWGRWR
jgi:hypothetical protein